MARVDGFENSGALLVPVESDTPELDKDSRKSDAGCDTRRENPGVTPGIRQLDEGASN